LNVPDPYSKFKELAANPEDWKHVTILVHPRNAAIAILAPHGGGIEPGTSELARALAGDEFSLYCLEGNKRTGNQRLHISSVRFDEPDCQALLLLTEVALTLHGCQGSSGKVFVGGLAQPLKLHLVAGLNQAGFPALLDGTNHAGEDRRNLCNRGRSGKGVQLELDEALRLSLFHGLARREQRRPTPRFFIFVETIRSILKIFSANA